MDIQQANAPPEVRTGTSRQGWHFLGRDRRERLSNTPVVCGQTSSVKGIIKLCSNGLHASELLIDALKYAPGPVLCRVVVTGDIQSEYDKFCGRQRTVLAIADIESVLIEEFGSFTSAVAAAKAMTLRTKVERIRLNTRLEQQVELCLKSSRTIAERAVQEASALTPIQSLSAAAFAARIWPANRLPVIGESRMGFVPVLTTAFESVCGWVVLPALPLIYFGQGVEFVLEPLKRILASAKSRCSRSLGRALSRRARRTRW